MADAPDPAVFRPISTFGASPAKSSRVLGFNASIWALVTAVTATATSCSFSEDLRVVTTTSSTRLAPAALSLSLAAWAAKAGKPAARVIADPAKSAMRRRAVFDTVSSGFWRRFALDLPDDETEGLNQKVKLAGLVRVPPVFSGKCGSHRVEMGNQRTRRVASFRRTTGQRRPVRRRKRCPATARRAAARWGCSASRPGRPASAGASGGAAGSGRR